MEMTSVRRSQQQVHAVVVFMLHLNNRRELPSMKLQCRCLPPRLDVECTATEVNSFA
jgi:hypothetical protein